MINATLHETVELNITAVDNDTITFRVINKPTGATHNQSGNMLYFTWIVTSSQKVRYIKDFLSTGMHSARSRRFRGPVNLELLLSIVSLFNPLKSEASIGFVLHLWPLKTRFINAPLTLGEI